jgi:hypothetical protein
MTGPAPTAPASPAARPDPVVAAFHRGLRQVAACGGDLVEHANRIGAIVWEPPRVVVVGRIKAGKSTLVNALIGAPVAETAALEATNVVTVYHHGAPARAEIVDRAGARRPVAVDPTRPVTVTDDPAEIAFVQRYLPSRAIEGLTLIDTPGLATLTAANEAATRRFLIDGVAQTRAASVDADAAVFLFDSTPRADEIAFLRELDFTPLNVLGVLSRADSFGAGVLGERDPLEHAAAHARELARQLHDDVATVLPVSGLLAETAHTGQLTEADAHALRALAGYDPLELYDLLDSDRPEPVPVDMRNRLLDLLGEYGVVKGREWAAHGAYALSGALSEWSGIPALRDVLYTVMRRCAVLHRGARVIAELESLAVGHPARDRLRTIVHGLRADPTLHPVSVYGCLRALLQVDPGSPLVADLRLLLSGSSPAQCLGLPDEARPDELLAGVDARLARVQHRATATTSAAEDAAVAQLMGVYGRMRQAMTTRR